MIDIPDLILPEHFDRTHIDILGRGPSVDSYVPRKGAFVISCHYPIARSDAIVSSRIGEWGFYPIPYIGLRLANNQKEFVLVRNWAVIMKKSYKHSIQTGHIAYIWACAQQPKSVHLWGFDSIFLKNSNQDHSEKQNEVAVKLYKADKMYGSSQLLTSLSPGREILNVFKKSIQAHTTIHKGE